MALLQSPEARLERESCAQECNADLCVVPVLFVSQVRGFWPAVAIIALATAAHQGWSCNMFTLASDMFSAARHSLRSGNRRNLAAPEEVCVSHGWWVGCYSGPTAMQWSCL
jgi:hypothetical protein